MSSSAEDQLYIRPQYSTPSSIPPLTQMPITTGLEETLSQTAHLEGKSLVLPGTGFVMSTATKTGTKGTLDMPLGPPATKLKTLAFQSLPIPRPSTAQAIGNRFTNQEQTGTFDIDTRMKQDDEPDEGQEMTYWGQSTECNWYTGGWTKSTGSADFEGQASTTKNMSSMARMLNARAPVLTN